MEIAVGIDGKRFATEAEACLWRIVGIEIAHDAPDRCLYTHKTYAVLLGHRMRFCADFNLRRVGRREGHYWHMLVMVAVCSVRLEECHLFAAAVWYHAAGDGSKHEVAA